MSYEIVMPFYGRVDHFKRAVQSVLDQDDSEWKMTIIDDVYPDPEPAEWVAELADKRIRYIRNETNLRPSRNYNKGAQIATSTFITLFGCDDVMLPGYVRRVKQLIAQFPDAGIIQPGVEVIDENDKVYLPLADRIKNRIRPKSSVPAAYSDEFIAQSLLRGNWTYFPSLVWRVDLIREFVFRTDLDVVQDLAMLLKIIAAGHPLVVDEDVVFQYRRHGSSVSAVTGYDGSKFRQERTLFHEVEQEFTDRGWKKAAREARHHWLSRANALRELPGAVFSRNKQGTSNLSRHVFRRPYRDLPSSN